MTSSVLRTSYADAAASGRLAFFVVTIVFSFIGLVTILLRLLALRLGRRAFGKDDMAMFAAWLCAVGFTAASMVSFRWGCGLSNDDVGPAWREKAIKAVFPVEVCYYFSVFLIKLSILFLYLRLASGLHNLLYKGTLVLMAIIVAQFISTVVVAMVQCIPMHKFWDPTAPGHCINITAFYYSTNVFTIITDCIMLALPIPTVWRIQARRAQRIGIVSVFLVGGISTAASCARLYSVKLFTESSMPLRDAAPINTWSFIEIYLGILCASASAIKPLFMPSRDNRGSRYFFAQNRSGDSGEKRLKDSIPLDSKYSTTDTTTAELGDVGTVTSDSVCGEDAPMPPPPATLRRSLHEDDKRHSRMLKLVPGPKQHSAFAIYQGRTREDSVWSFGSKNIMVQRTVTVDCEEAADLLTEFDLGFPNARPGVLRRLRDQRHDSLPAPLLPMSKMAGMRPTSRRVQSTIL